MTRVVFLVSTLNRGGAERQLIELVKRMDKTCFNCLVITVNDQGTLRGELAGLVGVRLETLEKSGRWDVFRPFLRATRFARGAQAIYSFEEGPNILGLFAARFAGCRSIWGIRNTLPNGGRLGRRSQFYRVLNRILARFTDRIIFNSERGMMEYCSAGYPIAKCLTVPNGFDSGLFRFDREGREIIRSKWSVAQSSIVFALVGSMKPDKNHRLFIEAAALIAAQVPTAVFAMIGREDGKHPLLGPYSKSVREAVLEAGLGDRMLLIGEQTAMPQVLSAIDILVLPSLREGMPNVVAEAMLCERLCIVADVGDAAVLVGGLGQVVPPGDALSFAIEMVKLSTTTAEHRTSLGAKGRDRICTLFSMEQMIERTSRVLSAVG